MVIEKKKFSDFGWNTQKIMPSKSLLLQFLLKTEQFLIFFFFNFSCD